MKNISWLIILAVVLALMALISVIRLGLLYRDVAGFKSYWIDRAGQPGEITYLALGDSAAQGLGASSPDKGYVGLIANNLAAKTGKKVMVINLSVSGAVVRDVISSQLPSAKNIKPDLVTIEIGANDVGNFDEPRFTKDITELVDALPKNTYISNMPYFATRPSRRPKAFRVTELITSEVKRRPDLKLVDLQSITRERDSWLNYAADLFHPNDRAYKNWAEAFWKEIEKDGQL